MKRSPISRLSLVLTLLVAFPLTGRAQRQPAPAPPPVRNLAVCFLFAASLPEWYYRNAENEPTPLQVERERFTTWNVIPQGEDFQLYRKETNEEGATLYTPAALWKLPPGDAPVRMLFYLRANGKPGQMFFEDAPGKHPVQKVRAINLTDHPVVTTFNDEVFTLAPQQEQFIQIPAATNVRFKFQYGAKDSRGDTRVSPVSNLRLRGENQRMTLIFGYHPEYDEGAETRSLLGYKVSAMRIYDRVDSPEAVNPPASPP